MIPDNNDHARAIAVRYVRAMLARGYTAEQAKAEVCEGYGAPGEAGYEVKHGRITVPSYGARRWTFGFAELAGEIEAGAGQMLLF